MAKEQEVVKVVPEVQQLERLSARESRIMVEWGLEVEALKETLRHVPGRMPFVYNLQLRAPVKDTHGYLMLIKAVGESGPVVAFHSDRTLVDCLLTYAPRVRAGKIEWREDEFPPSNFDEIAEYILDEVEYATKHHPSLAQGAVAHDKPKPRKP